MVVLTGDLAGAVEERHGGKVCGGRAPRSGVVKGRYCGEGIKEWYRGHVWWRAGIVGRCGGRKTRLVACR